LSSSARAFEAWALEAWAFEAAVTEPSEPVAWTVGELGDCRSEYRPTSTRTAASIRVTVRLNRVSAAPALAVEGDDVEERCRGTHRK
jgi:hypothetical protein